MEQVLQTTTHSVPRITLYASILGHGLEMYDFTLYSALLPFIASAYFKFSNSAFYLTLISLSTGYIARPFGALLIGYIADKYGRTKSLILTIVCASIATGAIGICPSYTEIGVIAPIVLVIARLLQGLCAGAETSNSSVYLIEYCGKNNSTFGSAMVFLSGGAGCIIALLSSIFFLEQEGIIGWRVPFVIGMVAGIIVLLLRLKVTESDDYRDAQKVLDRSGQNILSLASVYKKQVFATFVCGALSGITSTTLVIFANLFLQQYHHINTTEALYYSIYGMLAFLTSCFLCSKMSSRVVHSKIIYFSLIGLSVLSLPYFWLLNQSTFVHILAAQLIFGLLAGTFIATVKSLVIEQFPIHTRCTVVSLSYNLGYAVTSGTYILLSFWLIQYTGYNIVPFVFVCVFSLIMKYAVLEVKRCKKYDNK